VAQPPPPQAWYPPAAPQRGPFQNPALLAVVAVVLIAVVFFVAIASEVGGSSGFAFSFAPFFCIPFLFVIVFIIIAAASGTSRRTIPPPPPIQQPMVPAGQQGPVALSCPNCGGPPTNVDRFGVATCSYCGTRYLVR
jgi:hypothetical protein